jgi:hypothetical protein
MRRVVLFVGAAWLLLVFGFFGLLLWVDVRDDSEGDSLDAALNEIRTRSAEPWSSSTTATNDAREHCPTIPPPEDIVVPETNAPRDIGGVMIAVPNGYDLRAWLPDPPTYAGGGNFELPGLIVTVYQSVTDYELHDLALILPDADSTPIPPRYAEDLDDVIADASAGIALVRIGGCRESSATEVSVKHGVTTAVKRQMSAFGDALRYEQRGALELSDGRLVVMTLSGTGERPIGEQQGVFDAVLDSIARLN